VGAAEGSLRLREVARSADGTVDPKLATVGRARTGTRSAAAEGAVTGVAGASTGRLDVRLRAGFFGRVGVVGQGIQAGQTGSGCQKYQQQEESLGLDQSRGHRISIAGKT
jgi:hypothetical protein